MVKINKIEEQILPKVDDAFANLVDKNLKTVKELKDKFKENIQINLDRENKKEFHNKIVEYFLEKTIFESPKSTSKYISSNKVCSLTRSFGSIPIIQVILRSTIEIVFINKFFLSTL